jgi:hypothetical protein
MIVAGMPIEPVQDWGLDESTQGSWNKECDLDALSLHRKGDRIETMPPMTAEPRSASMMATVKGCGTCEFRAAVDRAECNACARGWQASSMREFIGYRRAA